MQHGVNARPEAGSNAEVLRRISRRPIPAPRSVSPRQHEMMAMRSAVKAGRRLLSGSLTLPANPPPASARPKLSHVARYSTTLRISGQETPVALKESIGVKRRRTDVTGLWLRDNCRCSTCVNQDTRQRNFDTFQIPQDITPQQVEDLGDKIHITWPDGHKSSYDREFIDYYLCHDERPVESVKTQFFGAEAASNPPSVQYDEAMRDDDVGMADLMSKIRTHGFAVVQGTPYDDPRHTERLLQRIGPIRETHYGGFYDFTPNLELADTAYTNLALPAHTDTTYFTEPAGLQSFHMLSHKGASAGEKVDGGKSLLVDAFHAASILKTEAPELYKCLHATGIPWHASGNNGITITPHKLYPVIETENQQDPDSPVHRIRWNNDDRGVVPPGADRWYEAARKWNEILKRKEMECWIQLEPGNVLIFDNWRVMHGRSAFTGIRRICGAYINRDDWISRWRNTNFPHEEVLKHVIG